MVSVSYNDPIIKNITNPKQTFELYCIQRDPQVWARIEMQGFKL